MVRSVDFELEAYIFREILTNLCAHMRCGVLNACISFDFLQIINRTSITNWLVLIEAAKPSLSNFEVKSSVKLDDNMAINEYS